MEKQSTRADQNMWNLRSKLIRKLIISGRETERKPPILSVLVILSESFLASEIFGPFTYT